MASRAGFVLTGGASSRMGRDKALLTLDGLTLVERTSAAVRAAAGSVTLVGGPSRYAHLGHPVAADLVEGCGPLGGVLTALRMDAADWNLIVACDMPNLTAGFLRELLQAADAWEGLCLVPETASGLHPLCAVYHRRSLAAVESAISHKRFKMHDLLDSLRARSWPVAAPQMLENVNTPAEWGAR